MEMNFTGHNVEVTPALRDYTKSKLDKLERHFDKITAVDITFNVEKLQQVAEASVFSAKTQLVHAKAESDDLYAAIDELSEKLNRQLLKHKEKNSHRE